MRQQTIFKKKDGCQIASKTWRSAVWADLTKQITNSSQKWTINVYK